MNPITFSEATKAMSITEVCIDDAMLSLAEFIAVAKYHAKVVFSSEFRQRVQKSRDMIDRFLEENRAIYGVTTGFGENVRYVIEPKDAITLQKNIVRSHACSVGKPLSETEVRACMLMMIVNTGKGHSGIRLETLECIRRFLNADLYPYAPSEGSVGYLAVEGHIALTFMGEGSLLVNGKKTETLPQLERCGISPVEYGCKEGLSLLNGSGVVTALALLSLYEMVITMGNLEIAGALTYEALRGTTKQLDPRIMEAKKHREQQSVAQNMLAMLAGSEIGEKYRDAKVQDAYVLRSMPHILGAAKKLIGESYEVIMNEMHSVSDNPELFDTEDGGVALMCGNFDGSFVGSHADMLAMACSIAGNLAERCVDRMVNRHLNDGLPAFLAVHPGLNNGFMIPQYTAAGLMNEIKILSQPSTIDSISTCANQEDPVSFAYFAAKKALDTANKLQYLTAIQYMTAAQAIDLLRPLKPSPVMENVMHAIREEVDFAEYDRFFAADIEKLKEMTESAVFIRIVEKEIDHFRY